MTPSTATTPTPHIRGLGDLFWRGTWARVAHGRRRAWHVDWCYSTRGTCEMFVLKQVDLSWVSLSDGRELGEYG